MDGRGVWRSGLVPHVVLLTLLLCLHSGAEVKDGQVVWQGHLDTEGTGDAQFSQRACHSSSLLPGTSKLLVFGGRTGRISYNNDLLIYDADQGQWTQPRGVTGSPPSARAEHSTVAFDGKLLIFGGRSSLMLLMNLYNDVHLFDHETMAWHQPQIQGIPPAARAGHTGTFLEAASNGVLPVERRVYIFGGYDGTRYLNDLNVLLLGEEGWRWARPAKSHGPYPDARKGHGAVAYENRLLVFGGKNDRREFGDLWVFDTTLEEWSLASAENAPSPRHGHAMAAVGSRVLLFGGTDGNVFYNDLYLLRPDTLEWRLVHGSQDIASRVWIPEGRACHTLTAVGHDLVVLGGWNGDSPLNDAYLLQTEWETLSWSLMTRNAEGEPGPSPRAGHVMTYLPPDAGVVDEDSLGARTGRLLVFGGAGSGFFTGDTRFNDLFVFDIGTQQWRQKKLLRNLPQERGHHAGCLLGKYFFTFGGEVSGFMGGSKLMNDLHVLDTDRMTWGFPNVRGQSPSPRKGHSLVSYRSAMAIIIGGFDGAFLNDVYTLSSVHPNKDYHAIESAGGDLQLTWTHLTTTGQDGLPEGRSEHTVVVLEKDGRIVVFGGMGAEDRYFDDLVALDVAQGSWSFIDPVNDLRPRPRCGHVAAAYESSMIIFGGRDAERELSDVWTFNFGTLRWKQHTVEGALARSGSTAAFVAHRLLVFGGQNGDRYFGDLQALDIGSLLSTTAPRPAKPKTEQQTEFPIDCGRCVQRTASDQHGATPEVSEEANDTATDLTQGHEFAGSATQHAYQQPPVKHRATWKELRPAVEEFLTTEGPELEEWRVYQSAKAASQSPAPVPAILDDVAKAHTEIETMAQRIQVRSGLTKEYAQMKEVEKVLQEWFRTFEKETGLLDTVQDLVAKATVRIKRSDEAVAVLKGTKVLLALQRVRSLRASVKLFEDRESNLRTMRARIDAIKASLARPEEDKLKMQADLKQLELGLAGAESEARKLHADKKVVEHRLQEMRKELSALPGHLETAEKSRTRLLSEMRQVVEDLEKEKGTEVALKKEVAQSQRLLGESESKMQQLQLLRKLTQEAEARESDLEKTFGSILDLSKQVDSLFTQLVDTSSASPSPSTTNGKVDGSVGTPAIDLKKKSAAWKSKVDQLEEELEKKRAEEAAKSQRWKARLETSEREVARLNTLHRETEQKLNEVQEEVSKGKARKGELDAEEKRLNAQMLHLHNSLKQLSSETEANSKRKAELVRSLAEIDGKYRTETAELQRLENEIGVLSKADEEQAQELEEQLRLSREAIADVQSSRRSIADEVAAVIALVREEGAQTVKAEAATRANLLELSRRLEAALGKKTRDEDGAGKEVALEKENVELRGQVARLAKRIQELERR